MAATLGCQVRQQFSPRQPGYRDEGPPQIGPSQGTLSLWTQLFEIIVKAALYRATSAEVLLGLAGNHGNNVERGWGN